MAIHAAIENGHDAVVEEFLEAEPSIAEERGAERKTPLILASALGRTSVVEALIALDVDLEGDTALLIAISKDCPLQLVKALLAAGADPAVENENHDIDYARATPFRSACSHERDDIAFALLDAGLKNEQGGAWPPRYTLLHTACSRGREAVVKRLLEKGAKVTDRCIYNSFTLGSRELDVLSEAAGSHGADASMIRMLVAFGADINSRNDNEEFFDFTPLSWTIFCRNFEAARELIVLGADVNAKFRSPNGKKSYTALSLLVNRECLSKDDEELIKLLKKKGAKEPEGENEEEEGELE